MKEKIKSFTIEGSLQLKEAFIKELGLQQATVMTLIGEYVRIQNANIIVGNWNKQEEIHFNLNSQYGEAINFYKEMIKEKEVVEVEVPEGYKFGEFSPVKQSVINSSYLIQEVRFKKKETRTPKELANEFLAKYSMKVGDKVWNDIPSFIGHIVGVTREGYVKTDKSLEYYPQFITNKVAIHYSNKEEFGFIQKITNGGWTNWDNFKTWNVFDINTKSAFIKSTYISCKENPIILTVEEYLKSIGETPLFTTLDGKDIYKGMIVSYLDKENSYIGSCIMNSDSSPSNNKYYYFSTEQSAKDYLSSLEKVTDSNYSQKLKEFHKYFLYKAGTFESILADNYAKVIKEYEDKKDFLNQKVLFYTEDFADGSFPVKNCNNCNMGTKKTCHYDCSELNNGLHTSKHLMWQGELKGEPIKKDDKCWQVTKGNCLYGEWLEDKQCKYFSNETNARNYFKQLERDTLLAKAKEMYPIGSQVKSLFHTGNPILTIEDDKFSFSNTRDAIHVNSVNCSYLCVVYENGVWATIVKPLKDRVIKALKESQRDFSYFEEQYGELGNLIVEVKKSNL